MKDQDFSKYKIKETSFRFVNSDARIKDKEFKTKPSSFAKDSFRRFCKNKSSIVGAIVLGVLILLSLVVPLFSPYSTDKVSAEECFLEPKLFKSGTGFWDGTVKYEKTIGADGKPSGVLYDFVNETPAGFYKPAVSKLVVDTEPTLINSVSDCGHGGYVIFENQTYADSKGGKNALLYTYYTFDPTATGAYKLDFTLGDDEKAGGELSESGEYRVYLANATEEILLKDWSKDYGSFTIDISKLLGERTDFSAARLYFELKPAKDVYSYILLEKCLLSSADENAALAQLSFTDASEMMRRVKAADGSFPQGYWASTGRKGIYASKVYYCSFTFDTYEKAYGNRETVYTLSEMRKFKEQGLCDFDETDLENTYRKLSDDFPVDRVYSARYNAITGRLSDVKADVPNWFKLGYKSEPKFILGTDMSGIDLFTRMFSGLRTSLLLGVCTAAFCFLFGLVWGSISGYFGGVVDLAMERFCDILGGVPWIVVMTLAILHLGNNFLTFFLALCLTGWMGTASITRTQFYRFKGGEYVLASRTLGASDARLIFKHILPNSLGTIVTSSVLMIVSTIYSESTLAYLNLGLKGTQAFGVLLSDNQSYIQSHPYLVVYPAIVMALLMISFNLFGNGLRDAFNPSLRGAEE